MGVVLFAIAFFCVVLFAGFTGYAIQKTFGKGDPNSTAGKIGVAVAAAIILAFFGSFLYWVISNWGH